jgi:hypothetical protein
MGVGDQGHWKGTEPTGSPIGGDLKDPPAGLGVVYYTPLPYRRHTNRHPRLVDASISHSSRSRSGYYRQFQNVSARLGIETQLIARLSHRTDIFARLIYPRLLDPECRLADPELERLRGRVLVRDQQVPRSVETADGAEFLEAIESQLRARVNRYGDAGLVALACLEDMAKSVSTRADAVFAFLYFFGIVQPPHEHDMRMQRSLHRTTQVLEGRLDATARFYDYSSGSVLRVIDEDSRTGIEARLRYDASPAELHKTVGAFEIAWENLSSGLLALIGQFCRIEYALRSLAKRRLRSALVLIDEGDAFLHMDWQRQYVLHLDQFLGELKRDLRLDSLQVIMATHSPIISGDFPSPMVHRLGQSYRANMKTFGSSLDALVLDAFDTPSIGALATRKVSELREKASHDALTTQDRALVREIGDDFLRAAVMSEPAVES